MSTMNLRTRILIPVLSVTIACFSLVLGAILLSTLSRIEDDTQLLVDGTIGNATSIVLAELVPALITAENMAAIMSVTLENPPAYSREETSTFIRKFLRRDGIFATWVDTEAGIFDGRDAEYAHRGAWAANNGRFAPFWIKTDGEDEFTVIADNPYSLPEGDAEYYMLSKNSGKPSITNPYIDAEAGNVLMVSLTAPFYNPQGKFVGVAGVDIALEHLNAKLNEIRLMGRGRLALVSMNGMWATHPDHKLVNTSIGSDNFMRKGMQALKSGEIVVEKRISSLIHEDSISVFAPLVLEQAAQHWGLAFAIPTEEVYSELYRLLLLSLISIFVIAGTLWYVVHRTAIVSMRSIIEDLTDTIETVHAAASGLASKSHSLSSGSSQQSAAIENISAALEEISSMIKQNAENAAAASKLTTEAGKTIDGTHEAMQRSLKANEEISRASNETQKIVKTIDEIAFQTNLLSLNAAVEAARAGEAGAGFAVVADEVRGLSMRSAEASKRTAEMIEQTITRVNDGIDIFNETGKSIDNVIEHSQKIQQLVGQVAVSSSEQAKGIEAITTSVSEMEKVVLQNTANSKESIDATEELHDQAAKLAESLRSAKLYIFGQ